MICPSGTNGGDGCLVALWATGVAALALWPPRMEGWRTPACGTLGRNGVVSASWDRSRLIRALIRTFGLSRSVDARTPFLTPLRVLGVVLPPGLRGGLGGDGLKGGTEVFCTLGDSASQTAAFMLRTALRCRPSGFNRLSRGCCIA